jgi:hypothetical protein
MDSDHPHGEERGVPQPLWGPPPEWYAPTPGVAPESPGWQPPPQPTPAAAPPPAVPYQPQAAPMAPQPKTQSYAWVVLALSAAVAALVVLGVVILVHRNSETQNTGAPSGVPDAQYAPSTEPSTETADTPYGATTSDSPSDTYAAPEEPADTDTPVTVVDGYRDVSGAAGIEVLVPSKWSVHEGAVVSNTEAEDPAHPNVVARFGGAPPELSGDLLAVVKSNETENSGIKSDYNRIELQETAFGGAEEAVTWEFTYAKNGAARHARALFWRLGGIDYVVYMSAPAGNWLAANDVFEVMASSARPR